MNRKTAVVAAAGAAATLAGVMTPAAASTVTGTPVPCSTKALVGEVSGAADGATLTLAKRCTYVLTAALPTVTRDLTIDGNGATLLRGTTAGAAAFTILTVNAGTVTLNRLNFTNGNGAITVNNDAGLTVTGGVFSGNTSARGAAIDHGSSDSPVAGVVQVTGASFIDNTATESGGAIYIFSGWADQFTDCRFLGNTAAGLGGAIYDWATEGTQIAGSTFSGNKAATGGALFLSDYGPWISGTVIQGNSASGNGGGLSAGNGGSGVVITGSKIIRNHAGGAGGGLDEEGEDEGGSSVTNTVIADNSATDGAGINEGGTGDSPDGTYTDDNIYGNNASGDGGGINATDSFLSVTGTTISRNNARGDGAGIHSGQTTFELSDASFTDSIISDNYARGRGGGFYNQSPLELSGTQVTGNRAAGGGGGIYNGTYDDAAAPVTLTGSHPAGNKPDNCEPLGSITGCSRLRIHWSRGDPAGEAGQRVPPCS